MYLTSANFIKAPEIILPTDEITEEINYRNNYIIGEVSINENNILDVLEILERPESYSYNVIKRVFSEGKSRISTSDVYVSLDKTMVVETDKVTEILDDKVYITGDGQTKIFEKADFTNSELVGIPDYKEISNITSTTIIEIENNRYIEIISEVSDVKKSYYIDLTNGLLTSYRVTKGEETISEIVMSEISITY